MINPKVHPTSVHICGVVVEYETITGRTNKGVATTWLRDKVPPAIKDSLGALGSPSTNHGLLMPQS